MEKKQAYIAPRTKFIIMEDVMQSIGLGSGNTPGGSDPAPSEGDAKSAVDDAGTLDEETTAPSATHYTGGVWD